MCFFSVELRVLYVFSNAISAAVNLEHRLMSAFLKANGDSYIKLEHNIMGVTNSHKPLKNKTTLKLAPTFMGIGQC